MTITEFLTARLDEDEAAARDVLENGVVSWDEARQILYRAGWHAERAEAHIVRHDPARVLADVAAKRSIVQAWVDADEMAGPYPGTDAGVEMGLLTAVHHLAAVYDQHPDWREKWRV